ncbi:MAG: hypothetical protein IJP67_01285 [Oscillospiraceae bacterium]|nr:hypothetical protein [Oscillospiraceae bacterium]
MYHYEYVSKKIAAPYKQIVIEIIKEAQNMVRERFTFQFTFIGSSSRNMITCDKRTNVGFDFDVNIVVNDDDECFTAGEIRTILFNAFTSAARKYGYNSSENSSRVFTLKKADPLRHIIITSCDFAVVHYSRSSQQYIRFNKGNQGYTWEYQKMPYTELEERARALRRAGCWGEVRDNYLEKKNNNTDINKHSRSLYAEAVNECYHRYCAG